MKSFSTAVALTAALCASAAAFAAPDPTDPGAAIPVVQYLSPFHDYRSLGEDKPLAWKAANEEVQRIGGWRAYAKEAAEARKADVAKPAPAAPASTSEPAPQRAPAPTPHKHGG